MSNSILCYDKLTGEYFCTTMEKLQEYQNLINLNLREDGHISYNDYIDVLTADLPEYVKELYKENRARRGDYCGVSSRVGEREIELTKHLSKAEDGTAIIVLQFDEIKKEP